MYFGLWSRCGVVWVGFCAWQISGSGSNGVLNADPPTLPPHLQSDIEKVRDSQEQVSRMHVPEQHIGGHAFHTYRVTSPDASVTLEFQHHVCGREVYAEGTVDAAIFLDKQIKAGAEKKLYNMIDVLSAGAMR